jgi:hypothetical protein
MDALKQTPKSVSQAYETVCGRLAMAGFKVVSFKEDFDFRDKPVSTVHITGEDLYAAKAYFASNQLPNLRTAICLNKSDRTISVSGTNSRYSVQVVFKEKKPSILSGLIERLSN